MPGTALECQLQAPQALGKVQVPYTLPLGGGGRESAQVACCLATRREPLGSFSGQSCPSHTRSNQSSCKEGELTFTESMFWARSARQSRRLAGFSPKFR